MNDSEWLDDFTGKPATTNIERTVSEAEEEANRIVLRLRCVEMASEFLTQRMQYQTTEEAGALNGANLIRLAHGIHNWITKGDA